MKKKKNGFTLIELLVVISIFGILMGLVVSQLGGVLGTSEKTKMQSIMRTWVIKLKQYKTHLWVLSSISLRIRRGCCYNAQ